MRPVALVAALALATPALAEPQRFDTAQGAVDALTAALDAADRDALIAVFGPENEDVILTGEDAADIEAWTEFVRAYREMARVEGADGDVATLYVGRNQWPMPIPIAKGEDGTWAFDADAAREEIFLRRIGRNELDAMAALRAYVEIQAAFRGVDHDGDGVMEFAERINAAAGARDGLHWPTGEDGVESPVGDLAAGADADASAETREPFQGYFYRILTAQGAAAAGGAMEYRVNGHMVAGHALLAFPAEYAETGVMTFMVGENGVIWETDLGLDTEAAARAIRVFDPGEGWTVSENDEDE
jgi:hypothetical protein